MIKNYVLTAFRNIKRHKGFSFINIFGLALSMSVCMLIIIVILDQFKFDDFITKRDRMYRIETINNMSKYALNKNATVAYPLYNELITKYALVEDAVLINNRFGGNGLHKEKRISIDGYYTNESFLNLFDFELTENSFTDLLKEPFTIILQKEISEKFFGMEDPIGKFISVDSLGEFKVTGIIKKPANKSQFQFDALVSLSTFEILENNKKLTKTSDNWEIDWSNYIYILVNKQVDLSNIQKALDEISKNAYSEIENADNSYYLKPFNKIVPGAFIGNEIGMFLPKIFIIFFGGLALVIIISAAFNYTSLSMARSLLRAKEVGVRKTVGATKKQLVFQFLSESILISIFASVIAFVLLQFILPAFTGMKMMALLELNPKQDISVLFWFLIFAIATGLLAGIFPAFYISSFNPIKVLKGLNVKILSKITFRKILLVTQFIFSMIFIISIILIYRQMNYMINAEMGFDRKFVYNIQLQRNDFEKVKNCYSQFPEVKNISGISHVPGVGSLRDTEIRLNHEDEKINVHYFAVDKNYLDVMGIELIEGNNLPENLSFNSGNFILINEKTVGSLQFKNPKEAIGKSIIIGDSSVVEIAGVFKSFQYAAMFLPERPLVLRNAPKSIRVIALRIETGIPPSLISKFESEWNKIDEYNKFSGEYLDTEIKDYYAYFEDILYTVGFTSILAIVIACLGLLGMATYSTQTKIKEIGVRKVFGAKNKDIIILISKTYIKLFIIAAIIAGPLAYLINNLWLQYIANHAPFGFRTIFIGIFIITSFGMLTITSQTLKASNIDPAKSLRYE